MNFLVLTGVGEATVVAIFWCRKRSADLSLLGWPGSILGAVLLAMALGGPVRAQEPAPPAPNPPPPTPEPPGPVASQPLQAAPASGSQPLPVAPRFSEESEIP